MYCSYCSGGPRTFASNLPITNIFHCSESFRIECNIVTELKKLLYYQLDTLFLLTCTNLLLGNVILPCVHNLIVTLVHFRQNRTLWILQTSWAFSSALWILQTSLPLDVKTTYGTFFSTVLNRL